MTLPTEKENWIVAGTQSGSLWAVNTEDETRRHRLQKMSDSITCLYSNSLSKQRYKLILNILSYILKVLLNWCVQKMTSVHSAICSDNCLFCPFPLSFCTQCNWGLHSWSQELCLLLVFNWLLEILETCHFNFSSYLIRAFLELMILFYFSKQKNFFLVGTADGKLAVFEDRAVKVDLFFAVYSTECYQ